MRSLRIVITSALVAIVLVAMPAVDVKAGWVEGYYKNDGVYVNGYWRSDPNGLKYDNYSFDGDWSDAFNDSYYSSSKSYSSDWYTPSWVTQDDYSVGKSFYDSRNSYSTYDYNNFDYDYNFWDDPIYDYSPSYDYGYDYNDYLDTYTSDSLEYDSLYDSSYLNDYSDDYNYDSYDYDYGTYDSYSPSYNSYDTCYDYYSC